MKPIDNPTIELRSIALSKDDPGDRYLENKPAFDKFGQWNLGDYEGKIYSEEQLQKEWLQEETEINETENFNYSRYGGYLNKRVKSTGFFRTEQIDDRWWLIDPDGYLFLSYGVDCVAPVGDYYTKNTDKCTNMFQELPPIELFIESEIYRPKHIQPLSVSGTYIVDTEKLSRPSCRNDNQKNGQIRFEYPCKLVG